MFNEKSKNSAYFKMKRYSDYIPNRDEFSENISEIPNQYRNNMNIILITHQNNIVSLGLICSFIKRISKN